MAGFEGWSNTPGFSSRQSQRSINRDPPSVPGPIHQRTNNDHVSALSQPLDQVSGVTGPSSTSTDPRQWHPAGGDGPFSPPIASPAMAAWSGAGGADGRSPSLSPKPNSGISFALNGQPSSDDSKPAKAPRPKPAPFQLDDSARDFSPARSSQPMMSPFGRPSYRRTDSRLSLFSTPGTATWQTPRTPPPYVAVVQPVKWYHWRPAWIMYIFFLFGVLCAIAHHVFYSVLHGKPADDQIVMLRYGTVLAFAAKAGLVSAIGVAFKQRIWVTVRNKLLSVAALDSLFAATEDVTVFLNFEILRQAKIAILLAAFIWATPLVIILTSNTLAVEPALKVINTTCPGIRTLNFEKEEIEDWRTPTKIDHLFGMSVSMWNTTSLDASSPDMFDYYTAPSDNLVQIATHATYKKEAVSKLGAGIDICGPGWNCTYVVNFTAPAYKCSEVASGVGSEISSLGVHKPPKGFSTDLLLPRGNFSWNAFTGGGDYSNMQMNDSYAGGMPKISPPYPEDLGAFRTEPIMWIGYVQRANPNKIPPNNASVDGWDDAFIPKVIACENWEADYTVKFNLTGGQQFTNVIERKFLRPIINTTWEQDVMANDGSNDNTTATPKSNYIYPRDVRRYRRAAAFHSIGAQVRFFINGTINSEHVDNPIQVTKALQTKLLDPRSEYFAHPNIISLIEEFHEDIILSLFSNYQFVSVVWAAKPDEMSGVLKGDDSTEYPCERSRTENRYDYHSRDLWIVYSIAILLSAIGIVSGTLAVLENEGVLLDTRFSSIVAATRGPALEKLGWGAAATADGHVPQDIKNLKVGYGVVHRNNGLGVMQPEETRAAPDVGEIRYGFGLEGDVRQMRSR